MDYKSTLNMPKTEFEMKANLAKKEPTYQAFWDQEQIYQKLINRNLANNYKQFVLHDGPPYANGSIHIGHALNKVLKDIIVTYKNMNYHYAPFIAGWDTHGLPIEVALSKKTNLAQKTVSERRALCAQYALEQVQIQKKQMQRLGLLTDFANCYLTLDHTFEIDQLKLFLKLFSKGYIYQDFKPVFWSWSSQSALAESEIEYNNVQSPAIFVKMQAHENQTLFGQLPTYYVIWTTTPWTLPANSAIAIHPQLCYDLVQTNNEQLIIAQNQVAEVMNKVGITDYVIKKTFSAKQLENLTYNSPINHNSGLIILAEYVQATGGTGLVHNAPGFGLDDFYACKKYNIPALVNIDNFGKFNELVNDQELEKVFYTDANDLIIKRLQKANLLLFAETITHSVAHDWRTKKPVMYRATKQWFVSVENALAQILKTLDLNVKSTSLRGIERMKEMVLNRKEWCISRQRVWGVPIPIIFDQNHEPILDPELVANIINVLEQKGVNAWFEDDVKTFLTPKYLSENQTFYKEQDIMDVWFDSGSSYSVLARYNLNYPADLYIEGYDQYRGWFNSSLITGTILHNQAPYSYLVAHGMVLDGEGMKMSKSKGNVVDPLTVCDLYGADVLRLLFANSDYSSDIRISEDILKQNAELYRRIRNTLFKYSLSVLADFDVNNEFTYDVRAEDIYVLNEFKTLSQNVIAAYERFDFLEVVRLFNKFILELSSWYFEIIKDDLYCRTLNDLVRKQIQSTIYFMLKHSLTLLTPIIPHTCEEAYAYLVGDKLQSIKLCEFIKNENFLFTGEDQQVRAFMSIKNEINNALENARGLGVIKKNNEAELILPKTLLDQANLKVDLDTIKRWINVAKVRVGEQLNVTNAQFSKCLRCWNHYEAKTMHNDELCTRCFDVLKTKGLAND